MPVDLMDLNPGTAPQYQPAGPAPSPAPAGADTLPGENHLRPVDIDSTDPLVNLGLVDPSTGAALPTDDWRPTAQPTQPTAPAQAQPTQAPGADQPAVDQARASAQKAQLQVQAANAYTAAVANGADPNQAAQMINAKLEAELAKVDAQVARQASLPSLKAQAAAVVAQKYGQGVVTAADLLGYDSPQAMETAAQQLAAARRDTRFQQRRTTGVDRAEGASSPAGINPAIAGLSPEKKIELGIRRGQFS